MRAIIKAAKKKIKSTRGKPKRRASPSEAPSSSSSTSSTSASDDDDDEEEDNKGGAAIVEARRCEPTEKATRKATQEANIAHKQRTTDAQLSLSPQKFDSSDERDVAEADTRQKRRPRFETTLPPAPAPSQPQPSA